MPLAHLLAALERDAAAQADALLAGARATAAAIARDADERLARRRSDVLGAREAELRAAAEAGLGEARRAARRGVLEARQRLLERVFAAARALFPRALADDAYRAALPEHLAQALSAVGEEAAVIRCADALVPAVRAALARKKHLAVQGDAAAPPGVTVVTADGAITVDNTLDGRLERLRPRLALEIVRRVGTPP
jgi:vacuolar-type H+-ATPase subunit E/Vma4